MLAECKTYNRFEPKDLARMKELARAFPGAILAFCMLREELTEPEKRRLARLATWGTRILKGDGILSFGGTDILSGLRHVAELLTLGAVACFWQIENNRPSCPKDLPCLV